MTEELAQELALVTAVILYSELLHGSIWQTFDNAYKIAGEFVKAYPLDCLWGEDHDLDYEETIINFTKNYIND